MRLIFSEDGDLSIMEACNDDALVPHSSPFGNHMINSYFLFMFVNLGYFYTIFELPDVNRALRVSYYEST